MNKGEEIIIGRMGQQPLKIADANVSPQHAKLRRTGEDSYQIEDLNSQKGVFVFGHRIKRKTVYANTPILLGAYKTTVSQLLADKNDVDLWAVWDAYDKEKRKWDRYNSMVNSIRMLTPVVTMGLTQVIGQNWMVSVGALAVVTLVAIVLGEKVLDKKNRVMAELNLKMQSDYICPHCHHFLGFVPYQVLKSKSYCPNPVCGCPLP